MDILHWRFWSFLLMAALTMVIAFVCFIKNKILSNKWIKTQAEIVETDEFAKGNERFKVTYSCYGTFYSQPVIKYFNGVKGGSKVIIYVNPNDTTQYRALYYGNAIRWLTIALVLGVMSLVTAYSMSDLYDKYPYKKFDGYETVDSSL